MLWLTAFFFLVEIIVGYVTNSMALIADSFHMLSDVAALVVAFLSVKVSFTNVCLIRLLLLSVQYSRFVGCLRNGNLTNVAYKKKIYVPSLVISYI